jgi:YD repeat-containing protein
MQQINYANDVMTTYGQNTRLWPGSFATQGPSGALYINSSYSYDGVGNLTAISDSVHATYYNRTLSYDNINRLVGAGSILGAETISYDGTGNLLSQLLNPYSIAYTYDTNNRLSSVSGSQSSTFTYDANGNVSSRTGFTYAYDDASNLTCVNCSAPVNSVAYTYDGVGHRDSVSKGGGAKTYEVFDARGKPLIEYTPATNKLVEYVYLGDKRIAQKVTP